MKILISAYVVDPESGSEPLMAWQWIYGAQFHNHEVYVLTSPDSAEKLTKKITQLHLKNIAVYSVPYSNVALGWLPREAAMYLRYWLWQFSLAKFTKVHNLRSCDLAHHTSWGNIGLGSGLSRLGMPFIFGPAGGGVVADPRLKYFFGQDWKSERIRTMLRRSYRYAFFPKFSVSRAKVVLTTNQATLQLAKKLGSRQTKLFLPDSIEAKDISKARFKPESLNVLYVARFLPIKGANLALRAFGLSLEKYPEAILTMVGDGPKLSEIKSLARNLGISDSVRFLGFLPWAEVQNKYSFATLFIFPSLRDNFGAQTLEAAAKGIPILTLENSGASEWIPEPAITTTRIGTPQETIKNLSDGINSIFALDPKQWKLASETAINFAQQNTRERKTEEMNKIYYGLTEG